MGIPAPDILLGATCVLSVLPGSISPSRERKRRRERVGGGRQTDKKGVREANDHTGRHTDRQLGKQTCRHTYILTGR